mmetsp:Transcript_7894/g.23342  ORF Transcript_7894/g.23342 Transcript_7894/m.23342 type:complete len:341 (-) Transcript_7894:985-2007(-)
MECHNPGGTGKDRAALGMLRHAARTLRARFGNPKKRRSRRRSPRRRRRRSPCILVVVVVGLRKSRRFDSTGQADQTLGVARRREGDLRQDGVSQSRGDREGQGRARHAEGGREEGRSSPPPERRRDRPSGAFFRPGAPRRRAGRREGGGGGGSVAAAAAGSISAAISDDDDDDDGSYHRNRRASLPHRRSRRGGNLRIHGHIPRVPLRRPGTFRRHCHARRSGLGKADHAGVPGRRRSRRAQLRHFESESLRERGEDDCGRHERRRRRRSRTKDRFGQDDPGGVHESIRKQGQLRRALHPDGQGDLGRRRRQDRRVRHVQRHRRHDRGSGPLPQGEEPVD